MKPPPFDQPSPAEVILLRAFLEAGDTFISGTTHPIAAAASAWAS